MAAGFFRSNDLDGRAAQVLFPNTGPAQRPLYRRPSSRRQGGVSIGSVKAQCLGIPLIYQGYLRVAPEVQVLPRGLAEIGKPLTSHPFVVGSMT